MELTRALPLAEISIISVVGAGGKTSFIFTLAKELAGQGKKVLITTTTAMFNPGLFRSESKAGKSPKKTEPLILPPQTFDKLFIGKAPDLCNRAAEQITPGTIWLGARGKKMEGKKLKGYSLGELDLVLDSPVFDMVLIEADGARMRPVKAPALHEPVIPEQTQMLAGCIGLDCLGKPLDERTAHRPELLSAISGQALGSPITEKTLISLIKSGQGLFKAPNQEMKNILVLNKADTQTRIDQGKSLANGAVKMSDQVHTGIATCFAQGLNPVKYLIKKAIPPHC